MVLQDPWGFDTKTYSGQEMRLLVAALTGGRGGVSTPSDLVATPQGSPNATVSVSAGTAIIPATHAGDLGSYELPNDAALTSPAFAAAAGSGRRDLLLLEVTAGVPALKIIQGTPSGSPVYPSLAGEENYIVICGVLMPAGKSIIDNGGVNGSIEDRRSLWLPYVVCSSTTRPPIPFDGQMIEEQDTERVLIWDAGNNQWAPSRLFIGTAASLPAAPKQGTPVYVTDANLPTGAAIPQASGRPVAPGHYEFDQHYHLPWQQPWGIMGIAFASANQSGITTVVDATGLSVTFTPVANRRLKITCGWLGALSTSANDLLLVSLKDGATILNQQEQLLPGVGNLQGGGTLVGFATPAAVAKTYKVTYERAAGVGSLTVGANANAQAFILVEDIGPNGQPT